MILASRSMGKSQTNLWTFDLAKRCGPQHPLADDRALASRILVQFCVVLEYTTMRTPGARCPYTQIVFPINPSFYNGAGGRTRVSYNQCMLRVVLPGTSESAGTAGDAGSERAVFRSQQPFIAVPRWRNSYVGSPRASTSPCKIVGERPATRLGRDTVG